MLRFLLVTCLLVSGCSKDDDPIQPGSHYPPEKIFQALIESPVPACISSLQGYALTWQGYNAWLRFEASAEYIALLIDSGFTPVKWTEISVYIELAGEVQDKFEPLWAPESLPNKKCYIKTVENDWTGSGTHHLVIDRDKGIVYFYGIGT